MAQSCIVNESLMIPYQYHAQICRVCVYYIRTLGVARQRLARILRKKIGAEASERALMSKLVGKDKQD